MVVYMDMEKQYIKEKQEELVRAIGQQGYSLNDIVFMFSGMNKSKAHRIIRKTPEGWLSPWSKVK